MSNITQTASRVHQNGVTSQKPLDLFWLLLGRFGLALLAAASLLRYPQYNPLPSLTAAAIALYILLLLGVHVLLRNQRWIAVGEMLIDTAAVALLVAITGGIRSYYILLFIIPILRFTTTFKLHNSFLPVILAVSLGASLTLVLTQTEGPNTARLGSIIGGILLVAAFCGVVAYECRSRHKALAELQKANEWLRQAAEHDYLTKLYNRRYFSQRLRTELENAKLRGTPLAVILTDLDNLKEINDSDGHEAGDSAIVKAAAVLSSSVRSTDIVARLGGDEFGILLPNTPREAARNIVNRISEIAGQTSPNLSISAGLAVYPEDADDPDSLLRSADQDLYRNKALKKSRSILSVAEVTQNHNGNGALILIAEDDPIASESLQELLQMAGYRTAAVSDGSQVVEMVRRLRPDTVLLDVVMPGADGTTVCRQIKNDPELRLTPVVTITGQSSREDKLAAIAAGADDFIRKPYDRVELLTRVKALVNNSKLNERLEDLEAVLFSLATAVEARDPYTRGHSRRVGHYAVLLGRAIGMKPEELQALHWGSMLHDIGKIGIPDAVLLKPGRLSEEEMLQIRSHPDIGANICRPLKSAKVLLPIIKHHHERWDGKGYPSGLSGEEIPLSARVVAVADAFDAITTDRPYRAGCPAPVAFDILREGIGTQFDPNLIEPFIEAVQADTSLPRQQQIYEPEREEPALLR